MGSYKMRTKWEQNETKKWNEMKWNEMKCKIVYKSLPSWIELSPNPSTF